MLEMPLPGCVLMDPCIAMNFRKKNYFVGVWKRLSASAHPLALYKNFGADCLFVLLYVRNAISVLWTELRHQAIKQWIRILIVAKIYCSSQWNKNKTKSTHRTSTGKKWTITILILFVTISIYILRFVKSIIIFIFSRLSLCRFFSFGSLSLWLVCQTKWIKFTTKFVVFFMYYLMAFCAVFF